LPQYRTQGAGLSSGRLLWKHVATVERTFVDTDILIDVALGCLVIFIGNRVSRLFFLKLLHQLQYPLPEGTA
jgi:hypothetical protein